MSLFPRNRVLLGALALALTMLVPTGSVFAAKPGNSPNAKACYKGGWTRMATANGVSFASQDECVANGAHGGTYGTPARVFAIAFTNLDGVAGFNRTADVLIAELVDTNRDNAVNAGDTVHTFRYPLTFAGTTFGTFGVTSHTVTGVPDVNNSVGVHVAGAGTEFFELVHSVTGEGYEEGVPEDVYAVFILDQFGYCDFLEVHAVSPSVPSVPVASTNVCPSANESFIDVTLNLP